MCEGGLLVPKICGFIVDKIEKAYSEVYKKYGSREKIKKGSEFVEYMFARDLYDKLQELGFDVCYSTIDGALVFYKGVFVEVEYDMEVCSWGLPDSLCYSFKFWGTDRLLEVLSTRDVMNYDYFIGNWVREVLRKEYGIQVSFV